MKKTKTFFAALLAVMMVALMIPFSASAATVNSTITLTCTDDSGATKTGYTFEVYQLATVDTETGAVTAAATDADVVSALNTVDASTTKSAAIIAACDAAATADLGTSVGKFDTSAEDSKVLSVDSGIYYVKCTSYPSTVKKVANSLVTVPEYDTATATWGNTAVSVNAGSKVDNGSVVITKSIVDGDNANYTTEGVGNTVNFKLVSDVTGSEDTPISSYVITDTMSEGLTYTDGSLAVALDSTALAADTDYTVATSTDSDNNTVITVTLTDSFLASTSDFYKGSEIVVTYSATVNENAVVGNPGNPNEVTLDYKGYGQAAVTNVPGNKVVVFTVSIEALKYDSTDSSKVLENAEFTAYTDAECTNAVATAKSGSDGVATFVDANGATYQFDDNTTYYIKETAAPTGYVLSTTVYEVTTAAAEVTEDSSAANGYTITADKAVSSISIANTPITVPQTGGVGTLLFTISGIALIACAGVLLVVVMRKKNAAK
ncbi:MAG: SpaH/EbpB family LPXTG-anchored major pilin [Clostridiales bacterium]|nr:SpaH/EbpB family LPXTG-anchored major pilin [Clostridiales bacterium]